MSLKTESSVDQTEVQMIVTCKPFAASRRGRHCVLVDIGKFPRVRVWDRGIFSVCHDLSVASQRAIIARARKLVTRCTCDRSF